MNTYTPKVAIDGAPWMMKDPQGGWVSLADHLQAMRAANSDPNDIEINTPLSEKVDHYKMVPVAEWEAIKQARAERDVLAAEVRAWRGVNISAGVASFVAMKHGRGALLEETAKSARAAKDTAIGVMNATDASGALGRAGGGA